jgi:hypothetical protein
MSSTLTEKTAWRFGDLLREITSPRLRAFTAVMPWLFYPTLAVVVFNYFEIHHNLWFLQLLDGYVIKMWMPPVLLFTLLLVKEPRKAWQRLFTGSLRYLHILLLLYVLFGFLSLVVNEEPYNIGKYGLIMFAPLTLYASIILVCGDRRKTEFVLTALFWSGVVLSLYVLYLYDIAGVESWRDRPFLLKYIWSDHVENFTLRLNYHQHHNYFAFSRTLKFIDEPAFAAMLAPLVLCGFHMAILSKTSLRGLYFIPAFFLLYTLLNAASRSAFIALLAALAVFLWFARKKPLHVIVILTVVAVMTLSNGFMQYRMIQLAGAIVSKIEDHSPIPALRETIRNMERKIESRVSLHPEGHVESIAKTSEDILASPLLGSGLSGLLSHYSSDGTGWGTEHNRYLYVAATAGLLTAVPYMLFIVALALACFVVVRRLTTDGADREIGVLLLTTVILFSIQILNCGIERYYYWVFFALAAAWLKNMTDGKRREDPAH